MTRTSLAVIAFLCSSWALSAHEPTLDGVFQSLRQMERDYDTVHAQCKVKWTIPKGTIPSLRNHELLPREDLTFDVKASLSLSGRDKWRFEADGFSFDLRVERLVHTPQTTVFNAGVLKTFMPKGLFGKPRGGIGNGKYTNTPGAAWPNGLFLAFRPLDSGLINQQDYKLVSTKATLRDVSCVVLEKKERGRKWSLWLESKPPFRVHRWMISEPTGGFMLCDFSYKKDGMLREWECLDYNSSGRLMQKAIAEMTGVTVGNAFAADEFELRYPPGTVVNDHRAPVVR
jgi:hypothetical protein